MAKRRPFHFKEAVTQTLSRLGIRFVDSTWRDFSVSVCGEIKNSRVRKSLTNAMLNCLEDERSLIEVG